MKLDDKVPMLRDCSVPNLAVADAREPWVERDVTMPAPAAEEAPPPGPIRFRQDQVAELHRARVTTYVETGDHGRAGGRRGAVVHPVSQVAERVDYDRTHPRTVLDRPVRPRFSATAPLGGQHARPRRRRGGPRILAGQSWVHLGTLTIETVAPAAAPARFRTALGSDSRDAELANGVRERSPRLLARRRSMAVRPSYRETSG